MNFHYSQNYDPPAPVVRISILSAAETLQSEPIEAFVDSGADGTIIPIRHLDAIHALPVEEVWMRSPWGERRRVLLYLVDIQIGELTLPGIEVVGDENIEEIILGRDVLNQLRVVLDGLGETVEISL